MGKLNFLIVGAMKAGTTSLVKMLNQHKSIHIPDKESYYFSHNNVYRQGESWYENFIQPTNFNSGIIVGEKCVSYSFVPEAVHRISKYSKSVKIIWILRDPVERTYSNYVHNVNNGIENNTFSFAIKNEKTRKIENKYLAYTERSNYASQVKRFLEHIDIAEMHFVDFEDIFIKNTERSLGDILRFLDIDVIDIPSIHANQSLKPVFPNLIKLALEHFGYASSIHRIVRRISFPQNLSSHNHMNEDQESYLRLLFRDHNNELASMINFNSKKWNK